MSTSLRSRLGALTPEPCVEAFIVSNLAFLGVDIYLAHAANAFARPWEWAPLVFSGAATLLLLPGLLSARIRARTRALSMTVAVASIAIGIGGMLFHLESAFFEVQTLRALVYTAPFAAPLAYVGLGLLLLLTRMERACSPAWGAWIVFLALGGFAGNLALALLDHAQNGFFRATEWVAVGSAAFGLSFLLVALLRPSDARFLRVCLGVLALYATVGVLGFALHAAPTCGAPARTSSSAWSSGRRRSRRSSSPTSRSSPPWASGRCSGHRRRRSLGEARLVPRSQGLEDAERVQDELVIVHEGLGRVHGSPQST